MGRSPPHVICEVAMKLLVVNMVAASCDRLILCQHAEASSADLLGAYVHQYRPIITLPTYHRTLPHDYLGKPLEKDEVGGDTCNNRTPNR